jgi:hypothetical protein
MNRKAADWGLDQPLWKGRLRILEKASMCVVVLEDGQTGARRYHTCTRPSV